MHSTHEYTAYDDPEICCRAIRRAHYRTEYRSKTCNIKKLDHEDFPCGHRHIVDSVFPIVGWSRSGRIHPDKTLDNLAINEISGNKQQNRNQKCYHF